MEADRLPKRRGECLLCILMSAVVFAVWWTAIVFADASRSLVVLGMVSASIGFIARYRSVSELGEDFVSDVAPASKSTSRLRTHRVYAKVRHPSELGLLLMTLGAAVSAGSWVSISLWCSCVVPLSWYRIRLEEIALVHRFGESYRNYQRQVGGYFPRLPRFR